MSNPHRLLRSSCIGVTTALGAGLLCLSTALPALAQSNYSRNCKPTSAVYISEGIYEGTFDTTATSSLGEAGISISHQIHLSGTFTLTVDRSMKANGELKGSVASDFQMKGMGQGISMPAQSAGSMDLSLKSLEDDNFVGTAKMNEKGTVAATGEGLNIVRPIAWDANTTFTFTAKHATCDVVDGILRISTLDEAISNLEQGGAKVSRTPIVWKMTNKVPMAEREKKIRAEMAQAVQGVTDDTRDAAAGRLSQVADRNEIKKSDCLFKIWSDFVVDLSAKWIEADAARLKGFSGSYAELVPIASRGLKADKALALFGRDRCSEAMHASLFSAIEGALARLLDRLLKAKAPAEDILRVLKDATVIGEVSPELNKRAMDRVMTQAIDLAETAYQQLAAALKAAGGKKDNPAVVAAAASATAAEKQCIALGAAVKHSAQQLMR